MGETFAIQIPYNIVVITPELVRQVNYRIAAIGHQIQFENLYAMAQNVETGAYRVEGKVKTGTSAIDIDDLEIPMTLEGVEFKGTTTHPRRIRLFSISQCIAHVLGWSTSRGIIENGKWTTQVTKFYEEDGEAATGISKTKHRLIMDGLGDALVVLVNVLALTKYGAEEINSLLSEARERIEQNVPYGDAHRLFHKMRLSFTQANDAFYQGEDWRTRNSITVEDQPELPAIFLLDVEAHLVNALWYMEALARAYNVTLEQCFSLAWDEIKDRKGFLNADGIFVKEADMTAEQKAAQGSL
ncbi:putative nucleoside triphosphate pyrophosphohydrolase [Erwinia phage pEa_SNUABM_8]|nr:putative nucleoside triphosphate pyrophosphohydrolase [Erwinia phage pEa_SNUABM_8]QVW55016.1 hypothetical protein pEaSNUABM4_00263 [Erwinia phage pEa_SNUABM_4]